MQVHLKVKLFTCDVCSMSFASKIEMFKHKMAVHSEPRYACDKCDKRFRRHESVKRHKIVAHWAPRPHLCNKCGRRYIHQHELDQHLRTHEKEQPNLRRPYACDQCDKSYVREITLKKHKWSFHQGIRPHACEKCGNSFGSSWSYKQHMLRHAKERRENVSLLL